MTNKGISTTVAAGLRRLALAIFSTAIIPVSMMGAPDRSPVTPLPDGTMVKYLSGTDKDHTVMWDFFCTEGAQSGYWSKIPVPSCWELQGFGGYNYGHDRNPHTEHGIYRTGFTLPPEWRGRRLFVVFEGVMTDAEVSVNGQSAGPLHQGAFYRFKHEITGLIDFDSENRLEVRVAKESSNASINAAERRADYWIFGGIFRPVYLEAQPERFIDRVAIDAGHNGEFKADVFLDRGQAAAGDLRLSLSIFDADGHEAAQPQSFDLTGDSTRVQMSVPSPKTWTSETPDLYTAIFTLCDDKGTVHTFRQRFGFRTIEFRERDGFYVNGVKIRFKGVCRHTFWPESGRTSSKALAIEDINLIKEMNMNAVRMSHYPPDQFFLDVCDSLGLYVIDELAGWQDAYDGPTACRLARDMVRRDVNHPSIVIWSNGNEGGFPVESRPVYGVTDIQKRHVVEPWSRYDGTFTEHYPRYRYAREHASRGDAVYMPTESLHGLHDGGHGAGLKDYWDMIRNTPTAAGQFLWVFADEGVVRRDIRDSIDVFNDKAPDGILGPHHEKEGSFYAIRQIWSPVHVEDPDMSSFDGTLAISNRYHFTNLNSCVFTASLGSFADLKDPAAGLIGTDISVPAPDVAPWTENAKLTIPLPEGWRDADLLSLKVADREGREICSWTWPVTTPSTYAGRLVPEAGRVKVRVKEDDNVISVSSKDISYRFNKHTGILMEASRDGKAVSFPDGPRFVGADCEPVKVSRFRTAEGSFQLKMEYSEGQYLRWAVLPEGWLRLDYTYILDGEQQVAGISFNYPEDGIERAVLLADGPYRVWKNRLQGVAPGLYDKKYNDAITGQVWEYPEFKGYYSHFVAVELKGEHSSLTIVNADEDRYLHMFTPSRPQYKSKNVDPAFPKGQLSVLNCIPAIGTKFSRAEDEGPSGEPNRFDHTRIEGTIYLQIK